MTYPTNDWHNSGLPISEFELREAMQRMQDEHASGRVDHNYRLWMLFNLEVFWRHFIDREPVGRVEEWVARARA